MDCNLLMYCVDNGICVWKGCRKDIVSLYVQYVFIRDGGGVDEGYGKYFFGYNDYFFD